MAPPSKKSAKNPRVLPHENSRQLLDCGHALGEIDYSRTALCDGCGKNTPRVATPILPIPFHNECREPVAERIVDKETGNFCDYFRPGHPHAPPKTPRADTLKSAADAFV